MKANLVEIPYNLSIRVRPDGFSFSIHTEKNEFICEGEQKFEKPDKQPDLKELFLSIRSAYPACQSVTLFFETDYFSLIPEELFKAKNATDLLKLHHPSMACDKHEIFHTHYPSQGCILLFAVDRHIIKTIQTVFPSTTVYHHLHGLMEREGFPQNKGERISIRIRTQQVDFLVFHKNRIQLLNSYPYQQTEDIVYHLLNILHHLHLGHETTEIEITRDHNIEIYPEEILKDYIPIINIRTTQRNL